MERDIEKAKNLRPRRYYYFLLLPFLNYYFYCMALFINEHPRREKAKEEGGPKSVEKYCSTFWAGEAAAKAAHFNAFSLSKHWCVCVCVCLFWGGSILPQNNISKKNWQTSTARLQCDASDAWPLAFFSHFSSAKLPPSKPSQICVILLHCAKTQLF